MLFLLGVGFWAGIALILAYEFYALHLNQGKTISEIVWRITVAHPLIAFSAGVLCGHLFWQSASVYLGRCR
jgi:hypothetical protein